MMWKKILNNPIKSLTSLTAFIVSVTALVSMLSNVTLKLSQPANSDVHTETKRVVIKQQLKDNANEDMAIASMAR